LDDAYVDDAVWEMHMHQMMDMRRQRDICGIMHMSGNLAPASCGCTSMHRDRRKPPTQIEGPVFELAKKEIF